MSLATPTRQPESPEDQTRQRSQPGQHHQRLDRLRNQERQRRSIILTLSSIAGLATLAGLLAVADYYMELSWGFRLASLIAIFAITVLLIVRFMRWLSYDSIDAVCDAEDSWPDIGQRLRTSHDYQLHPQSTATADPALLRALEEQTEEIVLQRPVKSIGSSLPIGALLGFGCLFAATWLIALAVGPEWRIATGRLLLLPVNYSDVKLDPLPDYVDVGNDLIVNVRVSGRPIETPLLRYRGSDKAEDWQTIPLLSDEEGSQPENLVAVIPNCERDLELQFASPSLSDQIHRVAVRLPLIIEEWNATVEPPEYTGLPKSTGIANETRVPAGSKVELSAKYNRAPKAVEVNFAPEPIQSSPARIHGIEASTSLEAGSKPIDVRTIASSTDGVSSESSLFLNVVADRGPLVSFRSPAEDAEAVATQELRFTMEALDDYKIKSVEMRYRIDDGPEQILWKSEAGDLGAEIAHTSTLALEELDVSYPQAIAYYAVAIDNRQPEPQRVTSELRFVDIRPFSRDYEFQEGECNCQGECLTLEKLITEQRQILGKVFAAANGEFETQSEAIEFGQRQSTREQELQDKTRNLTEALEAKIGPIPSLGIAIDWMSKAVTQLSDASLSDGQVSCEKALAQLVAARRNLRKILKQNNSQSSMAKSVDRRQMDQVRKPEKEKRQEREITKIREQIERLVEQQQSICESAAACKQSGSASSPSKSDGRSAPSREQLAEDQRDAEALTRQLKDELANEDFGDLAPERAEQAANAIKQSADALANTPDGEQSLNEAIAHADQAAEGLKRLSDHLGLRQSPDFEDKLATVKRRTEQLAGDQKKLSQSLLPEEDDSDPSEKNQPTNSARESDQRRLAERAEEIDDLIKQLLAESLSQESSVRSDLAKQASENPPAQAVATMNTAADAIRKGRNQSSSENGLRAAAILDRLASGLENTQQYLGRARMKQLVDAERQAASIAKEMQRANSVSSRAGANADAASFLRGLQTLMQNDPELTVAVNQATELGTSPELRVEGLRDIGEILQRRIQEAILSGVTQQAVGPVPPEYADMVEDYYRALSEDVE